MFVITNNKTTTRQFKSEQALVGSVRYVQVQRNEECESQNAQRQDLNDDAKYHNSNNKHIK